jgi:hypothetical protein
MSDGPLPPVPPSRRSPLSPTRRADTTTPSMPASSASAHPPPHRTTREDRGGGCLSAMVFFVLFVAGGIITYQFFWRPIRGAVESLRWRATPCTIVRSEVVQRAGAYHAEIRYRFIRDDQKITRDRIYFLDEGPKTYAEARALVQHYPEGSRQTCYVQERTGEAVLERGFKPRLLIALIPISLAVIGALGLLWRFLDIVRPRHPAPPPASTLNQPPLAPEQRQTTGPVVLAQGVAVTRRGRSGWGALFAVLLFGVIWNGIISFLVREVLRQWKGGMPGCHGWFLTFFAVPFVAVGLIFIVLPVYFFLKLFNARPTIGFSSGAVPLGESIEIAWSFTGRYDRIHRLRLIVEAREEATYRRGTDTTTDRETFHTQTLVDVSQGEQVRFGKTTLSIPLDTAPTFTSRNNRIVWCLRVIGEIRRWPNVEESFEFTVLPMPVEKLPVLLAGGEAR